ncbi:hypothetical protein BGZ54_002730 [Gamsiella multidivaricata]|nr:hypothetical protein BGZ54_002730 [Gamsiella multidivaricata]
MGGVLFSLDEDPKEFNQDMYVAMRNRIFELEAKTVNYAPFNRSRKRSVDRSADEYHGYHGYGRECPITTFKHRLRRHLGRLPWTESTSIDLHIRVLPGARQRPICMSYIMIFRVGADIHAQSTENGINNEPQRSRSYHLRKHLRMLDQQRDAQISRQKQHQEQQKEQQQQQEKQKQSVTIQRHYQPHQQMYPYHSTLRPLPILSRSVPHLPQSDPNARSSALHQQHQEKQQLIQRYQLHFDYQKQRELCQPQHQHLQKTTGQFSPSWAVIESPLSSPQETTTSEPHVTRMISRSIALASTSSARFTLGDGPNLPTGASSVSNGEVLCSACIQYMQSYGKSRPVPPFRLNFMRKVHCRFKKELLQLRFQGWQDTQILEIDDRMTEREFRTLFFAGMEEGLAITSSAQSGEPSSPKLSSNSILEQNGASVATNIQDDDDDDDRTFDSLSTDELRTFTSEASLGDLFGHRWKMEPIVGYTLVHFGGSDRTRMVPMNPTVSSLTVTYIRKLESVKFSFRVHVNGLCLLSSGGGPPALHMPEMADEEDSEDDQEAHEALEITEDQYDKLDTRQERDL